MNASLGLSFPDGVGSITKWFLKVANAERCGRMNACRQAARRVLLSMRHGVALSSRTGIDLSALDSGTLCAAGVRLLRCNISADLLFHGGPPPPVELCSHSAAVEGSGNHSAGCTLFAQTPVIAPLSRVGLLWVMAECVMLESTTFSCRTQKVFNFFIIFTGNGFYSVFYSVSLTTADNTQHHCGPYSEQIFKGLGPCDHGDHDTGTLNTLYFALSTSSRCLCQRWNFYTFIFFPKVADNDARIGSRNFYVAIPLKTTAEALSWSVFISLQEQRGGDEVVGRTRSESCCFFFLVWTYSDWKKKKSHGNKDKVQAWHDSSHFPITLNLFYRSWKRNSS